MASPQQATIVCSGSLRQRDPPFFNGNDDADAEDWLSSYERVSAYNRWDDGMKLSNVEFSLTELANTWFHNHKARTETWPEFKTEFLKAFGHPAVRKLRAEQRLRVRAQRDDEGYISYIQDVVDLCKRVDPAMPESDKIRHVLKGIEDYAFQMLLGKNPQTVDEVLNWCLSYDELRKQRVVTRQRTLPNEDVPRGSLSSLAVPSDLSPLLPHIEAFVRAEVSRQLALLPSAQEPAFPLPPTVRRVIQDQVAEALPSACQAPSVPVPVASPSISHLPSPVAPPFSTTAAAPLAPPVASTLTVPMAAPLAPPAAVTYASVVRQLEPGAFQSYQYTTPQRATPYPRPAPPQLNPWRTPDNRPICYACCMPGHVARMCRRRPPLASDVHPVSAYGSQPYFAPGDSGPTPSSCTSERPPFSSRRLASPRRRSVSPMRPRQNPTAEGN